MRQFLSEHTLRENLPPTVTEPFLVGVNGTFSTALLVVNSPPSRPVGPL